MAVEIYWKERKAGQQLVLSPTKGEETELGAVRKTPRGYDAFATTLGYDPGRAKKGFATLEEAKAFVEGFTPWDLFEGTRGLKVDKKVRPASQ